MNCFFEIERLFWVTSRWLHKSNLSQMGCKTLTQLHSLSYHKSTFYHVKIEFLKSSSNFYLNVRFLYLVLMKIYCIPPCPIVFPVSCHLIFKIYSRLSAAFQVNIAALNRFHVQCICFPTKNHLWLTNVLRFFGIVL